MEISGLPYIARASDAVPFNAVISMDKEFVPSTEAVSTALMPGNQESSTLRDLPARGVENVMHPSSERALPAVMFDPNSGMMHLAAGGDRLNNKLPEISMYEGKGNILDHWA